MNALLPVASAEIRRLAIMGGTFDPIHYGHLLIAEQAQEAMSLDMVVFVPNGQPAIQKAHAVSSAGDRYALCQLAISDNKHFSISPVEIDRGGLSYALDTVRYFRDVYPDLEALYFITGADVIVEILSWHNHEELIQECEFIAATRPGFQLERLSEILSPAFLSRIRFLTIPGLDISSTEIRRRVNSGHTVRYLAPDQVLEYIKERGLYR